MHNYFKLKCSCARVAHRLQTKCLFKSNKRALNHPWRPRGSQSGWEKRRDESFQARAEEPLGMDSVKQILAPDWAQQNALYYCAQSVNSVSWVLFVSLYMTIDSITACLAHAPKKCTQSGNFQFDINSPFQNTVYPKTKDAFAKIQAWALQQVFTLASITSS